MPGFLHFQHFKFDEPCFYCTIRSSVQSGQFGNLFAFIKSFQQKAVFFGCPWLSLFSLLGKAHYFIEGKIERPDHRCLLVWAIRRENLFLCSAGIWWREQQLYGSSRLGMWRPSINLANANASSDWGTYGKKFFELSNHLGNVMVVINDNRQYIDDIYQSSVISANDYYAFGGQMPGRSFTLNNNPAYRYGFNGKENDNEVKGQGNQQDYGMRIYDPRIGKFLSVDPITANYPELTPHQFASNNPTTGIDLDGLEFVNPQMEYKKHWYGKAMNFVLTTAEDLLIKVPASFFEIPGQMHYGNRVKPENQAAAFPSTHGQNIKDMALGTISAPIFAIGGVINEPSNEENWAHLTSNIILYRGLLKEKVNPVEAGASPIQIKNSTGEKFSLQDINKVGGTT